MNDETLLLEVQSHYKMWTDDNQKRMNRKNGWNAITDAYWGHLPNDWPYISRTVIPILRTSLIEKNGRLLNSKLRGKLVPREGGDTVSAILNNAILDYQWDNANENGSMLTKFEIADLDTRLYASKFVDVYWRYTCDEDGNVLYDGNELRPLDIRDCGIDPTSSGIKDAKWFQIRTWDKIADLESMTLGGKPMFKNLAKLKRAYKDSLNSKSATKTEYTPRGKQLQGLEDRTGQDMAFPVVKVVVERRADKWIYFSPDFDILLGVTPNPYNHKKLGIAQLRYYPIQDDPLGESEAEPVLPLWIAIQATVCAYMDEMILKIRPPLKVIENAARVETIQYGPEAQWLVDRQDAIEEMRGNGDTLQYFQTTFQVLTSAFNLAMGDLSQGTSQFDPFGQDKKTATEVKATVSQQNSRDQKNQNDLIEFIKDIMMMWVSNNKQFIFSDPTQLEYMVRIVGADQFNRLMQMGLADNELVEGTEESISEIVSQMGGNITDFQLQQLYEAGSMPKYPVILNPKEKDPSKIKMKPKMMVEGEIADVSIVPADLEGTYDYIPDVKSMAMGASDSLNQARSAALDRITNNPMIIELLNAEGYKPKIREMLEDDLEGAGLTDAERYFEKIGPVETAGNQMGGAIPNSQGQGLPGIPQANIAGGLPGQMGGPQPSPDGGGVPQAVFGGMGQGQSIPGSV
jgi:hypothetical protein